MVYASVMSERVLRLVMSNILKNKRLICFDLDGTLLDSVGIWNQIDAELIVQLTGITVAEDEILNFREHCLTLYTHYANPYLAYCECLKDKYQLELSSKEIKQQRYEISHRYLAEHVTLKPNAAQVIHALKDKGFLLALCTSTSIRNLQRYQQYNTHIQQQLNFEKAFDLIVTRENVQQIKPEPDIYLKALEHFSLPPQQCLVVEDAWVGVQAARAAEIDVIAIQDRYAETELEQIQAVSQLYLESFKDFLHLIAVLD